MKEIVFIRQSSASMGGVEWQIIKLAEKLFARGCFKPVLITSDKQSLFARVFTSYGFEVLPVPINNTKIISTAKQILHVLEGRNITVIQTHLLRESLIGRAIRRKRVNVRHIFRAEVYPSRIPCWKNTLCHLLDSLTSQWVDCYVANGQYLADEIISHSKVDQHKVIALLNGRDSIGPPDSPCDKPNESLPAKVAMIANFVQGKGHDCLIKALAVLKKRNLTIKVRLIGGDLKQNNSFMIKKLADKLGVSNQIEFYGYTKNVFGALTEIPVVILPSYPARHHSEGVPNCIFEAMSLRKLVIASNTGGLSEVIEHGRTGLLHKPKDYLEIADRLEKVFNSPAAYWENMRNAAFQSWRQKFTLDIMINKLVNLYKELGILNHD